MKFNLGAGTLKILLILLVALAGYSFFTRIQRRSPKPVTEISVPIQDTTTPVDTILPQTTQAPELGTYSDLEDSAAKKAKEIFARFQSGDYLTALKLSDAVLEDKEAARALKQWVRREQPAILVALGWLQLKTGDCFLAVDSFKRAELVAATDLSTKGLALCYAKLRNGEQSSQYFRKLWQSPETIPVGELDQYRDIYLQVLELESDFDTAVEFLQERQETFADKSKTLALLRAWQTKQNELPQQTAHETEHFIFRYRPEEAQSVVDAIAEPLEANFREFIDDFGFRAPASKIEVVFYPAQSFRSITNSRMEWAAAIFDGKIRVPLSGVEGPDQLIRTLKHELTHAMLVEMVDYRPIPTWWNEGFAQLMECDASPQCAKAVQSASAGKFLDETTLTKPFIEMDKLTAERAYRQSLYLVIRSLKAHGANLQSRSQVTQTIRQIMESMTLTSPLDNHGLLNGLGINFSTLFLQSARSWPKL